VLRATLRLRSNVRVIGNVPRKRAVPDTVLASCDGAKTRLAQDAARNTDRIVLAEEADFRVGDGVAIRDDGSSAGFAVTTATLAEKTGPKAFRLSQPLVQDYAVSRGAAVARAFPVVGGWNVQHATVESLVIDGNRWNAEALDGCRGAGIYLYACQDVTIRNCYVHDCRGDGISFQWGSSGITVEDCWVRECLVFGLHPGSDSHHCVVRRNTSTGNGGPGLFVCENVTHVLFEDNAFFGNEGPGVSIGCRDTDNVFRGNRIAANAGTGILFRDDGGEAKGAHRNVFEENVVLDNGHRSKDMPQACVTILGAHRDLVFRQNTLGNLHEPDGAGIRIVGEAPGLRNEANRLVNLKAEVDRGPQRGPVKAPADPRSE
jgi:parallel beta-helix repeat protein